MAVARATCSLKCEFRHPASSPSGSGSCYRSSTDTQRARTSRSTALYLVRSRILTANLFEAMQSPRAQSTKKHEEISGALSYAYLRPLGGYSFLTHDAPPPDPPPSFR